MPSSEQHIEASAAKTNPVRSASIIHKYGPAILTLAVIAIWLALALHSLQFFCYEDDEGTFLLTAQSMFEGHSLYGDVWYNYPPGLMVLVVAAFRVGGVSVESARTMMVLFGAATMLGVAIAAGKSGRRWAAPLAAALLCFTPNFVRMARSVMAETPASAFCVFAVLAALRYRESRQAGWLIVAGLLGSAAAMTKYPAAIILPIIGLDVVVIALKERDRARATLVHLVFYVLGALIPVVIMLLLIDPIAAWNQVVGTFQDSARFSLANVADSLGRLGDYILQNNLGLLAFACLGAVLLALDRYEGAWLLGSWPAIIIAAMSLTSRLKTHHLYLLLAPLALLAAIGAVATLQQLVPLFRRALPKRQALVGAFGVACLLAWLVCAPESLDLTFDRLKPKPKDKEDERKAVELVIDYTQPGDQVLCDYPMIAFRTGRGSPPWLTNISWMRLQTTDVDPHVLFAPGAADPPASVVMWSNRISDTPRFSEWVQENYVQVWREDYEEGDGEVKVHAIYVTPDRVPAP